MAMSIFVVAGVVAALILSAMLLRRSTDPYGLFHLELNRIDGEGEQPHTEWLNMGYWKDTDVFPEACEALALKLLHASRSAPGGNVLDVGHGTGDSLLLHLTHPRVPRPARLAGITSLQPHHDRASERVSRVLNRSSEPIRTAVHLYHGDAVYRPGAAHQGNHPLDPASSSPPFTTILALDCAYHFDTRDTFLRQAFARLAPGGRVALADIVFSSDSHIDSVVSTPFSSGRSLLPRESLARAFLCFIGMPRANMVSPEAYVRALADAGFVDVYLEDISEYVFVPFARFLRTRAGSSASGGGRQGSWRWATLATLIIWAHRYAHARFVIVSATKPAA